MFQSTGNAPTILSDLTYAELKGQLNYITPMFL